MIDWRVPDEQPPGFGVADAGRLDVACREDPRRYRWHPGMPCTLAAYGVEEARALEAGGVVLCVECGRPVLVPPATCLHRVIDDEDEEAHAVFRASDLRRS